MSKFQVGDVVTPAVAPGFPEIHPHVSKGSYYLVLNIEPFYVQIIDDLGVKSWWSLGWFKKTEEVKIMTAESLRDSYKALEASLVSLQQQVIQVESEKIKVVEQLKGMGFMLAPQKGIKSCAEDYSDPKTWKPGFMVKCVNDEGWDDWFVQGKVYKYMGSGCVKNERGDDRCVKDNIENFEFYSPF